MFARTALRQAGPSAQIARGVRFNSTLPIPPKIATPKSASGPGGSSARMESVVGFYKSLPKGDAPQKRGGGIKARYFDGKLSAYKVPDKVVLVEEIPKDIGKIQFKYLRKKEYK